MTRYQKENTPRLGKFVTSIRPGKKYKIALDNVQICDPTSVMVELNLSLNLFSGVFLTIDVLRDQESIIDGPKDYSQVNDNQIPNFNVQLTNTLQVFDKKVSPGRHSYEIVLRNQENSAFNVQIERYVLNIMTVDTVKASQKYNQIETIPVGEIFDVPLKVKKIRNKPCGACGACDPHGFYESVEPCKSKKTDKLVRIRGSMNITIFSAQPTLNLSIIRSDGSVFLPFEDLITVLGPPNINFMTRINLNFDHVDRKPCGDYILRFMNGSVDTNPININYYSFTSDVNQDIVVDQKLGLDVPRITIQPDKSASITVTSLTDGPKIITFLSNVVYAGIYPELTLVEIRKGNQSLTNGLQSLTKLSTLSTVLEIDTYFMALDNECKAGDQYTVEFINMGSFVVEIDYYNITLY